MNTKNPILLIGIGFVVAAFAFYHFAYSPKQKQAKSLDAQISKAQSDLDASRALLASNTDAKKSYRSSYSNVVRLGKAVPADDDVRSLIVQLDSAAHATHVNFKSIDVGGTGGVSSAPSTSPTAAGASLPPGVTVGPAGFPVMPFSFTFTGGFFRLGAFFHSLDALVKSSNDKVAVTGRLLTVSGVKLEPDTTGFPAIKATVQATSYLVSPLEGSTAGATPAGPAGTTPAAGTTGSTAGGAKTPPTTTAASTGVIR